MLSWANVAVSSHNKYLLCLLCAKHCFNSLKSLPAQSFYVNPSVSQVMLSRSQGREESSITKVLMLPDTAMPC